LFRLPLNVNLDSRVAVVTGAGGVLCALFSKALALSGARVALLDINEQAAANAASEITEAGGVARAYACNVLDRASCESAREAILRDFGPCSVLLNGAGGNNSRATTASEYHAPDAADPTFFNLDPEGVRFVFDLNFLGAFIPTQVFAADMLGREGCSVINVSSMNAYTPLTKIPAYSAAKAAVSNFTQWLAVHFSRCGIRVNAIAPGFFVTEQNRSLLTKPDGSPTPRADKILAATPLARFGKPEELVGTLLWLLCEEASGFVTGAVIPVDGGFSAYAGV
jgi:NAD(P)-dependent dehydrogenase (short-subunit alcohol dehydrogenase family)